MAYAFNQAVSSGNSTSASAQYDDEGYLIGGYSPAAGTYITDEDLLVNLQINDAGGMLDGSGGYYSYEGEGIVSRIQDPGIRSVAPEAYLIGSVAATRVVAATSVRLFGGRHEALRAACLAGSLCGLQANAAGQVTLRPSIGVVRHQEQLQMIRIGTQAQQFDRFRATIPGRRYAPISQ